MDMDIRMNSSSNTSSTHSAQRSDLVEFGGVGGGGVAFGLGGLGGLGFGFGSKDKMSSNSRIWTGQGLVVSMEATEEESGEEGDLEYSRLSKTPTEPKATAAEENEDIVYLKHRMEELESSLKKAEKYIKEMRWNIKELFSRSRVPEFVKTRFSKDMSSEFSTPQGPSESSTPSYMASPTIHSKFTKRFASPNLEMSNPTATLTVQTRVTNPTPFDPRSPMGI